MAATVAVPSAIVLKVLTTNNYEDWSFRVKTYLLAKGLWNVVESTMEPPRVEDGEPEFEAWSKNNAEALHAIHISCGDDSFSFIRGIDTAKAAWNTLEKKLKPAGLLKREDARSEHESLMDGEPELKDLKLERVVEGHSSNANSATNDHDHNAYQHFFDCVENSRWDERKTADALEFLKIYPHPIRELRHPSSDSPALHFAILNRSKDIAKELVQLMTDEDLEEILDPSGRTSICCALDIPRRYSEEIVKCMVEKDKKLLRIIDPSTKMIPLVMAHGSKWNLDPVVKYLYSVTPHETLNVHQAAQIISQSFINKRFDISWDLIQRYPSLAITKDLSGKYPLNRLAESMKWEHLFLSESGLNFLEQWIYDHIVIPPTPIITDISSVNVHDPENEECNQKRLIHSVTSLFRRLFGGLLADRRQERIYSLVYLYYSYERIEIFGRRDKFDNNMLHIVGNFSTFAQTRVDNIRGAALQLQRERQWFKEVESQVELDSLEEINHTDQAPPRTVFTKYHKELMKEGEKSMKETATSCTVVGALVVTMMFAAAFTVPGGNSQDTGAPMFL